MSEITAYFSHPIRGEKGEAATQAEIEANCQRAVKVASSIFLDCNLIGINIEIYCPGRHDEFVQIAYRQGILTEDQILDIDCEILSRRDLLLAYAPNGLISNGMRREINHAIKLSTPNLIFSDEEISKVASWIKNLKENFIF